MSFLASTQQTRGILSTCPYFCQHSFIFLQSLMQSLMQYNTTTSPAALDTVLSAHGPASFAVGVGMRQYLDFATVTDPSPVILLILYLYIWLFLVSRGVA